MANIALDTANWFDSNYELVWYADTYYLALPPADASLLYDPPAQAGDTLTGRLAVYSSTDSTVQLVDNDTGSVLATFGVFPANSIEWLDIDYTFDSARFVYLRARNGGGGAVTGDFQFALQPPEGGGPGPDPDPDPDPDPEPACFWVDLVNVRQVCEAPPDDCVTYTPSTLRFYDGNEPDITINSWPYTSSREGTSSPAPSISTGTVEAPTGKTISSSRFRGTVLALSDAPGVVHAGDFFTPSVELPATPGVPVEFDFEGGPDLEGWGTGFFVSFTPATGDGQATFVVDELTVCFSGPATPDDYEWTETYQTMNIVENVTRRIVGGFNYGEGGGVVVDGTLMFFISGQDTDYYSRNAGDYMELREVTLQRSPRSSYGWPFETVATLPNQVLTQDTPDGWESEGYLGSRFRSALVGSLGALNPDYLYSVVFKFVIKNSAGTVVHAPYEGFSYGAHVWDASVDGETPADSVVLSHEGEDSTLYLKGAYVAAINSPDSAEVHLARIALNYAGFAAVPSSWSDYEAEIDGRYVYMAFSGGV